MPVALILDHGASRAALAGARALAAAGWRVIVGSPAPATLASASRGVERLVWVPGPERGIDPFADVVARTVAEAGVDVVMPSDDHQMIGLSLRRAEIGEAPIPYPRHEVVVRSTDKLELHRAAAREGLLSPETAEATEDAIRAWRYPAIVKPRLHFPMVDPNAPAHLPVRRVSTVEQALVAAAEIRAGGGEPLLQEPIAGRQLSVSVVTDHDHRIVASLQQVATRLHPTGVGNTARAVSLPVEPDLLARVEQLLAGFGWTGLVQLEFRTQNGSAPRLIDFNGRLYGSVALGLHAGVNLPAAWADVALGRPVSGPAEGRPGTRYQWLEGDLKSSLSEHGPRAVPAVLAAALRSKHGVWDPRDLGPSLAHARSYARRATTRLRARASSG
jgi:predicted ATP-grasp superfamily ATP-dependent carboligase